MKGHLQLGRYFFFQTHSERTVAAHLVGEFSADPRAHLGEAHFVQPTEALHLTYNPLLALFGEHPSKTAVVHCAPEGEVEE